jgi:hypothetical protein
MPDRSGCHMTATRVTIKINIVDRLCGLVVRVPGYGYKGLGLIPGATRFSEEHWVWKGVHSDS